MTAINQQSTQQGAPGRHLEARSDPLVRRLRGQAHGRGDLPRPLRGLDATLEVSEDGAAKLVGTVDPRSIVVKDEHLAEHLQSPDFFDTERYPALRFESTSIRIEGDEAVLEGELTIKGKTNPVTARGAYVGPHEDIAGNTRIGLSFETVVDRTQYGLNWNAPLPKGGVAVANEVTLIVELEMAQA